MSGGMTSLVRKGPIRSTKSSFPVVPTTSQQLLLKVGSVRFGQKKILFKPG